MAGELIRVGVELDASGVARGATEAKRQFNRLAADTLELQTQMERLRQRAPAIVRGLGQVGFAAQSMAFSMTSGAGALRSLQHGLFALTIGSPWIMGAIAGTALIVSWLDRMEDSATRAAEGIGRVLHPLRDLSDEQLDTFIGRLTSPPIPGMEDVTGPRVLTPGEASSLNMARDEQARRRRAARRNPRGGKTDRARSAVSSRQFVGFPGAAPTKEDIQTLDLTAKGMNKIETDADRAARAVWDLGKSFDGLKDVSLPLVDGLAAGFGEMIDALGSGGNAGKAFFGGLLRELSRYAKAQAVIELAHGFSALILKPQAAAAHFKAAALFGAGAALAGAAGGGGGGGGSGGAFGRGPLDRARDPDRQVVIVQIVGQRPGEVISQTVTGINREQNLGGGNLRTQVVRVPVEGVMVARV